MRIENYYRNLFENNQVDKSTSLAALEIYSIIKDSLKIEGKVLEAGCGNGALAEVLIKKNPKAKVIGMDFSESGVKIGKKRGVKIINADLQKKFPFKDEEFDIIFSGQVIEHLLDPDFFLEECNRILKPNGKLVLTTPNLAAWFNRFLFLFGVQPFFTEVSTIDKTIGLAFTRRLTPERQAVGHIRVFTPSALKDIVSFHGFTPVKHIGYSGNYFPRWMQPIDTLASHIPSLASNTFLISTKK